MATAALLIHCEEVYKAMESSSFLNELDDGTEAYIWEGYLTQLWSELGKPKGSPTYTRVVRALQEMGCARQLQRGARATPSRWILFYVPTQAMFRAYLELHPDEAHWTSRVRTYTEMVSADQRALTRRLSELEGQVLHQGRALAILRGEMDELLQRQQHNAT